MGRSPSPSILGKEGLPGESIHPSFHPMGLTIGPHPSIGDWGLIKGQENTEKNSQRKENCLPSTGHLLYFSDEIFQYVAQVGRDIFNARQDILGTYQGTAKE